MLPTSGPSPLDLVVGSVGDLMYASVKRGVRGQRTSMIFQHWTSLKVLVDQPVGGLLVRQLDRRCFAVDHDDRSRGFIEARHASSRHELAPVASWHL